MRWRGSLERSETRDVRSHARPPSFRTIGYPSYPTMTRALPPVAATPGLGFKDDGELIPAYGTYGAAGDLTATLVAASVLLGV